MPNIWQTPISSTPDSKPGRYSGRGDVDWSNRLFEFFRREARRFGDLKTHGLPAYANQPHGTLIVLCSAEREQSLKMSARVQRVIAEA